MPSSRVRVYVHLVWATWDRLPLITEANERLLHDRICAICQHLGCTVIAIGGVSDHVHLLLKLPITLALAHVMETVKGGSSRFVSQHVAPEECFRWQGSYGAHSISQADVQRVARYIRSQRQHHTDGTVWSSAEETG